MPSEVLSFHSICIALLVLASCERPRPHPPDDVLPVTIPHPGYLDGCVPTLALHPGEQRRIDFQCPGLREETQSWWGPSREWDDVQIKLTQEHTLTCGLCGCGFTLAFATSAVYGQLISQPGSECGKSRQYCVRIQRLRKPEHPDPWTLSLASPPCLSPSAAR
jgi:hypothetical protein